MRNEDQIFNELTKQFAKFLCVNSAIKIHAIALVLHEIYPVWSMIEITKYLEEEMNLFIN